MKAKVIFYSDNEADVFMDDGGVATFHHNEEHMITTYYQNRVIPEMLNEEETIWDVLGEGKSYARDWEDKQVVDDEMIEDATNWLCLGCEISIRKFYINTKEIEELEAILLDFECNYDAETLYGHPREYFEKELNKLKQ